MVRIVILLVLVLGCGASKPAATTGASPPADPQSCPKVADHLIDLMSADAMQAPPGAIKRVHDVVLQHCEHDHWSDEARKCFVGVTDREDGRRCDQVLTDTQRAAIDQEMGKPAVPRDGGAPSPPPPAADGGPPTTRAPKSRKGGDPCEGGE